MVGKAEEAGPACRKLALVVGAGVSGVQAARALLRAGYDALILEQGHGIGGVWRRNYHSFGLQVPWGCFTFPEFPYSKAPPELAERAKREEFPSGNTVQDYIAAYVAHFDLGRHMVFGAKVVHLSGLPSGRWCVRFRQAAASGQAPDRGALKTMEADVVVLATGMYFHPYVPAVPGLASFKGRVLHARDFTSVSQLQGKRVVVLGAGKSAHDCAVVAASEQAGAAAVTTVFRQAHWPLPRVLFGIPFHKIVYTRFTAAMLPMYYTAQGRPAKRFKHALLSPVKRLFWRTLEGHVARKMKLRGPLRPDTGFVEDLFFGGQIQDGSWNEAVNAGRISAVQGSLAEILPGGVRLADGTNLDCDVLIFATGYTKDYSLFDAATVSRLLSACPGSEGLHLYRSILSPWVPNLYFIGCEASSFNNALTSGLQSLWMLHHLLGSIRLPPSPDQMKDVMDQRTWRQGVMPPQCYSSSTIMLYQQRYHDQLVADMHHHTRRKQTTRRGGSEYFGVYTATDYEGMFEQAALPPSHAPAAAPARTATEIVAAAVTLMLAAAAIGARLDLAVLPGGGGAVAQRRGVLLPVCGANSGAAAIAIAPGVAPGVESGPNGAAAAQAIVGRDNSFLGSFDSPRPGMYARTHAAPAAPAASTPAPKAAVEAKRERCVLGPPPAAADVRPALAPKPEEPLNDYGDKPAAEGPGPSTAVGGMESNSTIGCERLDLGTGAAIDTGPEQSLAAGSLASPFIDLSAAHASIQTGSPTPTVFNPSVFVPSGGRGSGGVPPVPLAQQVKLQVLHLCNRSPGGTLYSPQSAGGEDVLELRMQSNTGATGRVGSIAATSQAATAGEAVVSSSICCDAARHAAPNMYSELMGTLEVH